MISQQISRDLHLIFPCVIASLLYILYLPKIIIFSAAAVRVHTRTAHIICHWSDPRYR